MSAPSDDPAALITSPTISSAVPAFAAPAIPAFSFGAATFGNAPAAFGSSATPAPVASFSAPPPATATFGSATFGTAALTPIVFGAPPTTTPSTATATTAPQAAAPLAFSFGSSSSSLSPPAFGAPFNTSTAPPVTFPAPAVFSAPAATTFAAPPATSTFAAFGGGGGGGFTFPGPSAPLVPSTSTAAPGDALASALSAMSTSSVRLAPQVPPQMSFTALPPVAASPTTFTAPAPAPEAAAALSVSSVTAPSTISFPVPFTVATAPVVTSTPPPHTIPAETTAGATATAAAVEVTTPTAVIPATLPPTDPLIANLVTATTSLGLAPVTTLDKVLDETATEDGGRVRILETAGEVKILGYSVIGELSAPPRDDWMGLGLKPHIEGMEWGAWPGPTPIQRATIPAAARGEHVIGWAMGGSGKTGAFVISAINTVDPLIKAPQVVIAVEGNALANQIFGVLKEKAFAAGKDKSKEVTVEHRGRGAKSPTGQVLVTTIGKLLSDIHSDMSNKVDRRWTRNLRMLILDEADKSLKSADGGSMVGRLRELGKTAGYPGALQVMLFSATFECLSTQKPYGYPPARKLVCELLGLADDFEVPLRMPVSPGARPVHSVRIVGTNLADQPVSFFAVDVRGAHDIRAAKVDFLNAAVFSAQKKSMVFCDQIEESWLLRRAFSERLEPRLMDKLWSAALKTSRAEGAFERDPKKDIAAFTSAVDGLLLATPSLERGLDFPSLKIVAHVAWPSVANVGAILDIERFLHRSNRVGRHGQTEGGSAVIAFIASPEDEIMMLQAEKLFSDLLVGRSAPKTFKRISFSDPVAHLGAARLAVSPPHPPLPPPYKTISR